ncbi:metallophosphoesterase [Leptolyngbya sp. BL0902]|nr:metallophosphoesterase [Leptolyngbya sp. BL0902]
MLGLLSAPGGGAVLSQVALQEGATAMTSSLLSDPFLLWPTVDSVQVVWFTEFEGQGHWVEWGQPETTLASDLNHRSPGDPLRYREPAVTNLLSRSREDADSQPGHPQFQGLTGVVQRPIWRHRATVTGLAPGQRYPYRVVSELAPGQRSESQAFTLAASPAVGQGIKILLTSDHQNLPMVAANLQKVQETLGHVDAVFCAGDLVNVPDRASEWFDNRQGNAFFPALQGRAHYNLDRNGQTTTYHGGELIQHAPLFPAIGNHEVMGPFSDTVPLKEQFNRAIPKTVAEARYPTVAERVNPGADPQVRQNWIVDQSFNTRTYEDIFGQPQGQEVNTDSDGHYYAVTLGDVRLITLYVTQIWRPASLDPTVRGRYQERQADLDQPEQWGHGQHIFEAIDRASPQYQWLAQELASDAFQRAKYTVVMLHHPPHTLGDNIVPAFTTPVPVYDYDPDGRLTAVRYEYPRDQDYIARDLVPLLEAAGVNLVLYGHSHLWNRFTSPRGTHYLETSNVGNSYGAFWQDRRRPIPTDAGLAAFSRFNPNDYVAQGDPNGLAPIVPTVAPPLVDDQGQPLPYLDSNHLTAFSILDTASGDVRSYAFDTRQPGAAAVEFDRFALEALPAG